MARYGRTRPVVSALTYASVTPDEVKYTTRNWSFTFMLYANDTFPVRHAVFNSDGPERVVFPAIVTQVDVPCCLYSM